MKRDNMLSGDHISGRNLVVPVYLRQTVLFFTLVLLLALIGEGAHVAAQTAASPPQICSKGRLTRSASAYLLQRCFDENRIMELRRAILRQQLQLVNQNHATATSLMDMLGITRATLNSLLLLLSEAEVDVENQAEYLADSLRYYRVLQRDLNRLDAEDLQGQHFAKIAGEIANGNWNEANTLALVMETRALSVRRKAAPNEPLRSETAAIAEFLLGQIALVRGDYGTAARHFNSASDFADSMSSAGQTFGEAAADALYRGAKRNWDEHGLQEAVNIYRRILGVRPKSASPELWARTQNKLGTALLRLGAGTNSVPLITGAISAFEATLEVRMQGTDPAGWMETTINLADAMIQLGTRLHQQDDLRAAILAYRSVISQMSFEDDPGRWVELQTNLGNALWSLGRIETGDGALKEAIAVYNDVLSSLDHERQLRDWGATQNNIGAAYYLLTEREPTSGNAQKAVAAFEASLAAYREASAVYFISGVRKNLTAAQALQRQLTLQLAPQDVTASPGNSQQQPNPRP